MAYAYEAREIVKSIEIAEREIVELMADGVGGADAAHAYRMLRTARLFMGEVIKEIEGEEED